MVDSTKGQTTNATAAQSGLTSDVSEATSTVTPEIPTTLDATPFTSKWLNFVGFGGLASIAVGLLAVMGFAFTGYGEYKDIKNKLAELGGNEPLKQAKEKAIKEVEDASKSSDKVANALPVGTVIASMLPQDICAAEVGDPTNQDFAKSKWWPADGHVSEGTTYNAKTGLKIGSWQTVNVFQFFDSKAAPIFSLSS